MIGQTVSHYKILDQLGVGGMGIVYRAEDTELKRFVALKFLPAEIASNEKAIERFRREARAAAALNHPNICTIHEIGDHEGRPFIVMELLEGEVLKDRLVRGALPTDTLLDIAVQIAQGLDAAHGKGMLHRDVKPANIFLTRDGGVKVLDFGLAKLVSSTDADADTVDTTFDGADLTRAGAAVGTVAYMSPEQVRGEELDTRSDLFSFGLVLYQMATGQQPFAGSTSGVVFEAILNRTPITPVQLNPDIPAHLESVINKALEKDRDLRYQHASGILSDLKRLRRDTDSQISAVAEAAEVPSAPPAGRKALVSALVALGATVLLAFLLWFSGGSALEESDFIVLTDFDNQTGEPVFDDTLKQALALTLSESPFINVVSDRRVRETLQFMDRSPDDRVTAQIGQEICQREGVKAMMTGGIVSLGTSYVITLTAVNCATGDTIAAEQVQAGSREQVLSALGDAASNMRRELGESLGTIETFSTPIEQATTSSLEALKAFSLGDAQRAQGREQESIPFFERAVELDPDFAVAYARLGTVQGNSGNREAAIENYEKAFELRERASERERFYLTAHYYNTVEGDSDRAADTYRLWRESYPFDSTPPTNLASIYTRRQDYAQSAEMARISVDLEPHPISYGLLAGSLRNLGKIDEWLDVIDDWKSDFPEDGTPFNDLAGYQIQRGEFEEALRSAEIAVQTEPDPGHTLVLIAAVAGLNRINEAMTILKNALNSNPDDLRLRLQVYGMAMVTGEPGLAAEQVEWAKDSPTEHLMWGVQAGILGLFGRVREAEAFYEQAIGVSPERGRSINHDDMGFVYLAAGVPARALEFALEGARASTPPITRVGEAVILARLGEADEAEAIASALANDHPDDEAVTEIALPVIYALSAIAAGEEEEALELLSSVPANLERAEPGISYFRGLTYRRQGLEVEAIAQFDRLLENPGTAFMSIANGVFHLMARLNRARALAALGRTDEAAEDYQELFDFWKDADPDMPTLLDARAEFANLG